MSGFVIEVWTIVGLLFAATGWAWWKLGVQIDRMIGTPQALGSRNVYVA